MKRIVLSGGFHNVGEIGINIPADLQDYELNDYLKGLYETNPRKIARVQKHFCGVSDCVCGGVFRDARAKGI